MIFLHPNIMRKAIFVFLAVASVASVAYWYTSKADVDEIVVLCSTAVNSANNKCPDGKIVDVFKFPRPFILDNPRVSEYHNTSFNISFVRGYRSDIDEFIRSSSEENKIDNSFLRSIRIAATSSESYTQFVERTKKLRQSISSHSGSRDALTQDWVYMDGYKILRELPEERADQVPYPTTLLPLDGSPFYLDCMNDPSRRSRVGCLVYDYTSPKYSLRYSYVFTGMPDLLLFSRNLHQAVNLFKLSSS